MSDIKTYRDLIVWQKAMQLVVDVYRACDNLPANERFGLDSQIKRAAVSIPSNIAEGYGRHSTADYIRFLHVASGSLNELQTQLEIALRVGYLDTGSHMRFDAASREVERLLSALIRSLER